MLADCSINYILLMVIDDNEQIDFGQCVLFKPTFVYLSSDVCLDFLVMSWPPPIAIVSIVIVVSHQFVVQQFVLALKHGIHVHALQQLFGLAHVVTLFPHEIFESFQLIYAEKFVKGIPWKRFLDIDAIRYNVETSQLLNELVLPIFNRCTVYLDQLVFAPRKL